MQGRQFLFLVCLIDEMTTTETKDGCRCVASQQRQAEIPLYQTCTAAHMPLLIHQLSMPYVMTDQSTHADCLKLVVAYSKGEKIHSIVRKCFCFLLVFFFSSPFLTSQDIALRFTWGKVCTAAGRCNFQVRQTYEPQLCLSVVMATQATACGSHPSTIQSETLGLYSGDQPELLFQCASSSRTSTCTAT